MSKVMHFLLDYSEKEENVVVKILRKNTKNLFTSLNMLVTGM